MEEEVKIEEMKMEMKKKGFEFSRDEIVKSDEKVSVKLPKLKITKFEGTALDWFRFWNQFETEIDQVQISPISKFSYLKELLVPKVRLLIDGLPFTSEGYTRVKSILTSRYGKSSEIATSHIHCVTSLPVISNCNPNRIQEFYEKLTISVQALETMKKLKDIKVYVRVTLDKLPGIRADLVRLDDNWQEWDFCQLVDSLRRWTERNPKTAGNPEKNFRRESLFQVRDKDQNPAYVCVYCEKPGHEYSECELVSGNPERRLALSKKKSCFNCTGSKHHSNKTCANCKGKHYTSIFEKTSNVLLTTNDNHLTYPLVIIDIEGIKCRALIDTRAGAL